MADLPGGGLMQRQLFNAAAAALVAAGAAACSSPAASPPPGEIPPGTARVTINDRALPVVNAVKCLPIRSLTTIAAGNAAKGITAQVSNEAGLEAKTLTINDMGGFTGRFTSGLEGKADVSMAGRTYVIRGTADGFDAANPSVRTASTFAIEVSC
ncbi:MAG: ipoprotein LpqH [Pseudonocardiales bacterium]|jgi:lipoprotein LpqH|nr:ipoprotein LpqH [Pseudonocardiales bacterium]